MYGGRHFQEVKLFDTHSTAKFSPLANLKKIQVFFSKNPSNFSKKLNY